MAADMNEQGSTARVAAVDDDPMVRAGFAAWLADRTDLEITAVTATVAEFLDHPCAARTDVVLLDLNLRDGVEPADNIAGLRAAGHTVLVVSVHTDPGLVVSVLEAGAAGYLVKKDDGDALAEAVHMVAAGGSVISPEMAFAISRDRRPDRPRLSPKELAVIRTYASGVTLAATARRVGIAYGTAREYLDRVKKKYEQVGRPARTKLELAARLQEDAESLDPPPGKRAGS